MDKAFSRTHVTDEVRPREEPMRSTTPLVSIRLEKTRGRRDKAFKILRPSTLKKLCKKIDGLGDLNDHVAFIMLGFCSPSWRVVVLPGIASKRPNAYWV